MKDKRRLSSSFYKWGLRLFFAMPVVIVAAGAYFSIRDAGEVGDPTFFIVFLVVIELFALLLYTSFNDVYYDNEYIYVKEFYKKEFKKYPIAEVEKISHTLLFAPDLLFVNNEKHYFILSRRLYFKLDVLGLIKGQIKQG